MTDSHRRIRAALLKGIGDTVRYIETKDKKLAKEVQRMLWNTVGRVYDMQGILSSEEQVQKRIADALYRDHVWRS